MHALALTVGTTNLQLVERPEVFISAPDDVKVKIIRVGICGTDREVARGGRALAPDGGKQLVIGHDLHLCAQEINNKTGKLALVDSMQGALAGGCDEE